VNWVAKGLDKGEYQGQLLVQGGLTGSTAVVPYWYANPDGAPQYLNTLGAVTQANAGSQVDIFFKVKDSTGTAITDSSVLKVKTAVVEGNGKIQGPFASSNYVNWLYLVATLSSTPGTNTFSFQVQGFNPISYTIQGLKPGTTKATDGDFVSISKSAPAVEGGNQPVNLTATKER
jgi:hypothetical protein